MYPYSIQCVCVYTLQIVRIYAMSLHEVVQVEHFPIRILSRILHHPLYRIHSH